VLPDPALEPTVTVERGGALFGLGRSKAYIEARRFIDTDGREGLPAIAFGRTLRVPTARLLEMLGLGAPVTNGDDPGNGHGFATEEA
jgi:hypothetical protein